MATAATLRRLLEPTSVPASLVEEFLADTNTLWLLPERDDVVAGEIVLCHPALEPDEVRAVVKATDNPAAWRITVVAWDRPGLLTATAGVLANQGLTVTNAAVTVLDTSRLALQRLTVHGPVTTNEQDWDRLGVRLRNGLGDRRSVSVPWKPTQPIALKAHPQGCGRVMVQVEAPDTIGLLWAITRGIKAQGANIEAARMSSDDGIAKDVFIVVGTIDAERLAADLSEYPVKEQVSPLVRLLTAPLTLSAHGLRRSADLLGRLRTRPPPA